MFMWRMCSNNFRLLFLALKNMLQYSWWMLWKHRTFLHKSRNRLQMGRRLPFGVCVRHGPKPVPPSRSSGDREAACLGGLIPWRHAKSGGRCALPRTSRKASVDLRRLLLAPLLHSSEVPAEEDSHE